MVLKDVGRMDTEQVRALLEKTRGDEAPLGRETCVVSESISLGRINKRGDDQGLSCMLPFQYTLVVANNIFIGKSKLPHQVLNCLIWLATKGTWSYIRGRLCALCLGQAKVYIVCG